MISYFIVAHCMLTTNFSSRLKFQFHVIFGQDSFPLNMGSFQASLLLQNYTNCLLTNGWSRTVSSRTVSSQMDGHELSPHKWMVECLLLPLLLTLLLQALDLFSYAFSYACRWLLLILSVWSHLWYFWISLSCFLMQAAPVNRYIHWNSVSIFNHILLGI